MEEERDEHDEGGESSSLKIDYNSSDVVKERIKAMLQRLEEKTDSKRMTTDEFLLACHIMIHGIASRPRFQQMKLLNCERLVFEPEAGPGGIQRPKVSQLSNLMSPWLELADFAYESRLAATSDTLEAAVQKILGSSYSLLKHSTDVRETVVGYYLVSNPEKKHIIICIKGTSSTSVS